MNRQINLPFRRTGDFTLKSADQIQQEQTDLLKRTDTDHDGLSDYDELYVYHTSPFLADSDSDGIPDGVEVAEDTDPNCPQGKVCREQIANTPATGATAQPDGTDAASTDGGAGTSSDATAPDNTTTSGDAAPMAVSAGTSAGASGSASAPTSAQISAVISETFGDPTKITPDELKADIANMSATDLRSFLGKLGIPSDVLLKADDATLRKVVVDTMNSIATAPATPAATDSSGSSDASSGDNTNADVNANTDAGTTGQDAAPTDGTGDTNGSPDANVSQNSIVNYLQ